MSPRLTALVAGALVAFGCKREASDGQVAPAATSAEVKTAEQPASSSGQAKYDESAFGLEITASNAMKSGGQGVVSVALSAKAPYHVNAEYPHRFKVLSAKGASVVSPTVTVDSSKLTPARLTLDVPVSLTQAGSGEVLGEMAFSVCTSEKCLMEKRTLRASLTVE
jgi:hypothetical protein